MSSTRLHIALLRPPILHILRAAGFYAARPAAVDTLVDLALRYLVLLATHTASHAASNAHAGGPTVQDVRMALDDAGALRPQRSAMEEQIAEAEDLRGVESFLEWIRGDVHKEMRRVAGLLPSAGELVPLEPGAEREDYLTALKKKHSKTGEETRYQGTVLGKDMDARALIIDGSETQSIQSWEQVTRQSRVRRESTEPTSVPLSSMSSPLSDI